MSVTHRREHAIGGLRIALLAAGFVAVLAIGTGYSGISLTPPSAAAWPAVAKMPSSAAPAPSVDATAFVVCIDAGHQAHANLHLEPIGPGSKTKKYKVAGGTSGRVTHAPESVIDLRVALRLREALTAAGITVVMVRTKQNVNIPNSKRAIIGNDAHADLTVRIHCDGTARSIHGILMLVPKRNRWTGPIVSASARASRAILSATLAATGARSRGTTPRSDMSGFNWSLVPSVIIEMGNMKNATEDRLLSNAAYEQKLAEGIARGVLAYGAAK
jgi:N-acetylmuramoyl-L-alanine amidase